jgi:aminoglycoside 6'-N-acetyltransferase I
MRCDLWPEESMAEHRAAIDRYFAGDRHEPEQVLLAVSEGGEAVGFIELSIRHIVDGCSTERVGYVEGWYVAPSWRRKGVGRALIVEGERWAQERGCTEFASDTAIDNLTSRRAHLALGFEATGQVENFRKDLRRSIPEPGPLPDN